MTAVYGSNRDQDSFRTRSMNDIGKRREGDLSVICSDFRATFSDLKISMNDKETGAVGSNPKNITLPANEFISNGFGEEYSWGSLPHGREDPQINITECTDFTDDYLPAETICLDEPEFSSSFDESVSDLGIGFGGQEVDSASREEYPLPSDFDPADGFFSVGKPKVSYEWGRFSRSIICRCRWLELKIKEIELQAKKYDKQLDEYDAKKQYELEKKKSEGIDSKSLSLSWLTETKKVIKRKTRERVEQETDIGLYMSQHHVFSYRENRKQASLGPKNCSLADYFTYPKTKDDANEIFFGSECLYPEFRQHDKIMSELILKIVEIQSRAREMKKRVEKLIENSEKRCPEANLASPEKNMGGIPQSACALTKHTEDLLMPQNAGSSPAIRTVMEGVKGETEMDGEDDLNYFEKVINEYTCNPDSPFDSLAENSPVVNPPVTKSRVSRRKWTQGTCKPDEPFDSLAENSPVVNPPVTKSRVSRRKWTQGTCKPDEPFDSPVVNPPVTKSRVSKRKRKRQVSWTSPSVKAQKRSAAARQQLTSG